MMKFVNRVKISRLKRNISTSGWFCSDDLFAHRDSKHNNPQTPFDFSQANLKRLSAIIQNYPVGAQRSAISAAMDIVQRQIGWIPISAMHKVAEVLSIPRMRVYEWATFYTMNKRKFRGKFNVKVCVTTPCMLRGSDEVLAVIEELTCCCAGGLSSDGMFGVDKVQCQGACANAPVVVVDDDYYEDVDVDNVHNIIQTLKCGGIPPWGPQTGINALGIGITYLFNCLTFRPGGTGRGHRLTSVRRLKRSARFSCEPITGPRVLCEDPPGPGHGLQPALYCN